MKEYDITLWQSTDPSISARITIYYSGSQTDKRFRDYNKICISCGLLDVWILKSPSETLLRTLRNTLIALASFPLYMQLVKLSPSRHTHISWEKNFSRIQRKKFMHHSQENLLSEALVVMALIQSSFCGGRLNITTSQNVRTILQGLHLSVYRFIQLMLKHEAGREKLLPWLKQCGYATSDSTSANLHMIPIATPNGSSSSVPSATRQRKRTYRKNTKKRT